MRDDLARFGLVAQERDMLGRGADEFDADGFADFGKVGVFGKEPITGMDGVCSGNLGRAQDVGNISVAECRVGRPDADLLVGGAHMQARCIGFGKDRHSLNAEFLAGADHTERDFAAIGYQDFFEHASTPVWGAEGRLGCGGRIDKKERLTIFHRFGAFGQNFRNPPIHL